MAMDPEDPFNLMPLIENQENTPFNLMPSIENQENTPFNLMPSIENQENTPFNLMPLIGNEESWEAWADRSPPGYKFHPSDETLISKYLIKKQLGEALPPNNIPELTTYYSTHPEVIVVEHPLHKTQDSLFFFSHRDEKYPQHTKAIRDAANGYWRTTTNVPVHTNNGIGQKRTLVFLEGKMKKTVKTDWHMHEYSIKIKPTPNAGDWVIVRLSPPQPKMKSLQPGPNTQNQQPQNDQLQHRQLLSDFGTDWSWENSAPQGPQPLQPQMVQNVNLLQPYPITQNHQMYKRQNDPLQHRQLLGDSGTDQSWENPTPQGLQPMQPQMEKNVNLLISHDQQMFQPKHGLQQFMQQLGDFGADWSLAPQGPPPMQLPFDFGADQPAVYEGSPFGANWSNLRSDWPWEQQSTAADSLLGSNILPNANLDIAQQNLGTKLNPTAQLGVNPGGGEQMTDEEN